MNGTGNMQVISAEFVPMRKALLTRRNREGADTAWGHLLSNVVEQTHWLADSDERPWAVHPMQTVKGMMQWQLDRLSDLGPRRNITELSLERLREVLSYDSETGHLKWRIRLGPTCDLGGLAGCVKADGYRKITIDGVSYHSSHLAWFHYHGSPPADLIDHRNQIRDDDRIENLREATHSQNSQNIGVRRTSSTGLKGASRFNNPRNKKKFSSSITVNGKRIHLGLFHTAEEAHEAYCKAAEKYHGEFARTE